MKEHIDRFTQVARKRLGKATASEIPEVLESVSTDLYGAVKVHSPRRVVDSSEKTFEGLKDPEIRPDAIGHAFNLLGRSVSVCYPLGVGWIEEPDAYTSGDAIYRGFVTQLRAWVDGYVDVYVRPNRDRTTGEWVDSALVRLLERR